VSTLLRECLSHVLAVDKGAGDAILFLVDIR